MIQQKIIIVTLLLSIAFLSGCAHYSYSVSGSNWWQSGGVYYISSCPSDELKKELLSLSNEKLTFLDMEREDAVDLRISIGAPQKTSIGGLKIMNNIGSCLTLGIIPWRDDDQASQLITLEGEGFSRTLEVEASSCQEIGHLPLPLLGIGDILYFTGGTVAGAVIGILTVDFKVFLLGFGVLYSRHSKKKEQTAQSYLVRNVDYAKLARVIAGNLSRKDYQTAMGEQESRRRFLPASMIADYNEIQSLDAQLRPFALKNAPQLWRHFQEVRAALDVQEEKINRLRIDLIRLGAKPEKDEGYIRVCDEKYQLALLLRNLHAELKKAYREAQLFESSFRKRDYDEIYRRTQENGLQDAKMLQDYYRKLK